MCLFQYMLLFFLYVLMQFCLIKMISYMYIVNRGLAPVMAQVSNGCQMAVFLYGTHWKEALAFMH